MPLSTPAYFLYLSGQISKDWIKAPSILLDKKVTCDDTIGNGEEELDQVGEDVVVDQWIVVENGSGQEWNHYDEVGSRSEHVHEGIRVEGPSIVTNKFSYCVSYVVCEKE